MATLYYGCTLNYVYTFTMAFLTTLQAAAATLRLPDPAPCGSNLERLLRDYQCNNETATDLQGLGLNPDPTPDLLPGLTLSLTLTRRPTCRVSRTASTACSGFPARG